MHPQINPTYAELIAGILGGNSGAVAAFRKTFTPGIQFLITRESDEVDVADRVEKVVVSVIQEIKKGHIASADLAAEILKSLRRNAVPGAANRQRRSANPDQPERSQVALTLLMDFPERERKALSLHYVDRMTENEICAGLRMTLAEFRDTKFKIRTQFMNTRRQPKMASKE